MLASDEAETPFGHNFDFDPDDDELYVPLKKQRSGLQDIVVSATTPRDPEEMTLISDVVWSASQTLKEPYLITRRDASPLGG